MGMYTCLKFTGQLKEKYADIVRNRLTTEAREKWWEEHKNDEDQEAVNDYNEWVELAKEYPFMTKFSKLTRSDFIPFGGFTFYNIDKVGREKNIDDACFSNVICGDDRNSYVDGLGYIKSADTWVFACDLKDYCDEIETFIEDIATELCTQFVAEVWYEEDGFPDVYIYKNGILERVLK